MFEITYPPLPEIDGYLGRIGYRGSLEPTLEVLNELILLHQCAVPFENLDCRDYGKPVSLEISHLYEKIVQKRRGGYCFELNGLFMTLLRALGFDAWSCLCRTAAQGPELRPINHRGIMVRLEGALYFCDVGFGGPMPSFAVRICGQRQSLRGETYWAEPMADEGWYLLRRLSGKGLHDDGTSVGQVRSVAIFSPLRVSTADFEAVSRQYSTSPDSTFVKERIVSLRTEGGYVNLRNRKLTIMENGCLTQRELPEAEIPLILKDRFGLEPCEYSR